MPQFYATQSAVLCRNVDELKGIINEIEEYDDMVKTVSMILQCADENGDARKKYHNRGYDTVVREFEDACKNFDSETLERMLYCKYEYSQRELNRFNYLIWEAQYPISKRVCAVVGDNAPVDVDFDRRVLNFVRFAANLPKAVDPFGNTSRQYKFEKCYLPEFSKRLAEASGDANDIVSTPLSDY